MPFRVSLIFNARISVRLLRILFGPCMAIVQPSVLLCFLTWRLVCKEAVFGGLFSQLHQKII